MSSKQRTEKISWDFAEGKPIMTAVRAVSEGQSEEEVQMEAGRMDDSFNKLGCDKQDKEQLKGGRVQEGR